MKKYFLPLIITIICFSCNQRPEKIHEKPITDGIAIFEVYLEDTLAVNNLSNILRDTLKLPVEWEPFDIFGNEVVYDAAFYLGNTTLELLSVNPPIEGIKTPGKYNRLLFHSNNIDSSYSAITAKGFSSKPPFDFNIVSDGAELSIGKQINLDSLSKKSNVNVSLWQYLNPGYHFKERFIKENSKEELLMKLDSEFKANPMGIIELKEIHLKVTKEVLNNWRLLMGPDTDHKWFLSNGPIVSFEISNENIGVDWITIGVQNLDKAKEFLSSVELLAIRNNRVTVSQQKVYGLKIYVEE
ncbi:hypothetical protein [Eudoraea adriatica]|uniref:hypothetical protein n=1 Tax=Eudoraea adriatica TaxID=446681 RepID=UPI00036B3AE0|nr:hypothetical protein [Eudoraea adriatica]